MLGIVAVINDSEFIYTWLRIKWFYYADFHRNKSDEFQQKIDFVPENREI